MSRSERATSDASRTGLLNFLAPAANHPTAPMAAPSAESAVPQKISPLGESTPLSLPAPYARRMPNRVGLLILALSLGIGVLACAPDYPNVLACEDVGELHAICGLQNPEDLALLPEREKVIVSQFGSMDGTRAGSLVFLDLEDESIESAFEGGKDSRTHPDGEAWGDAECPGPPGVLFSPHGIDLAAFQSERLRLLVVNHGGRESVEIFEVNSADRTPELIWRGCALPPEGTYMNDVVSLPDGGFLVTHMMSKDSPNFGLIRATLGLDTGRVYEWHRGRGFTAVPGTEAPFPNGIELSEDARSLFLNVYSSGEVRRIERESGRELGRAAIPGPDNITWGRRGQLLVASHRGSFADQLSCLDVKKGACGMEFAIVALEPENMETTILFSHAGAPMGAGTVALDLGDGELLIGSFAADRMLRVPPRK